MLGKTNARRFAKPGSEILSVRTALVNMMVYFGFCVGSFFVGGGFGVVFLRNKSLSVSFHYSFLTSTH